MTEEVAIVEVFLDSEADGYEAFEYEGIDEAVAGIRRLWLKCNAIGDGIERTIGVMVNPEDDEDDEWDGRCVACGDPVCADAARLGDWCGAHCPECYKRLYAKCEECGDEVHKNDPDAVKQASGGWLCWLHADKVDAGA